MNDRPKKRAKQGVLYPHNSTETYGHSNSNKY
jgi:hypothetical protein